MILFGKKKKTEKKATEQTAERCCNTSTTAENLKPVSPPSGASVKVLGSGCAKCNALEKATKEALAELGMDTSIEHVTDFTQIASYGVMSTPALVVDGKVVSYGRVLSKDAVRAILKKVRG